MNKTISINISGFAFIIEEQAYQRLQKYLTTIRSYFTSADGVEEIMTDIEIRIAEIFRERLGDNREVVDSSDVEHVIAVLGQPEAFIDEGAEGAQSEQAAPRRRRRKRIFRDPDNKVIGGVASGIAAYFGTDPVWIRLLFVLLVIFGLSGIAIYIVMWIIMPQANTAGEKLEMRGEPVTAENIGRTVSESFDRVKKNVSDLADSGSASEVGRRARNNIEDFFVFVGNLLLLILKAIVKIIGFVFIIVAIVLIFAILALLFGFDNANLIHVGGQSFPLSHFYDFAKLVVSPEGMSLWFFAAAFVSVIIPVLALLYGGIAMLFNLRQNVKGLGIGLTVIWFIGLFVLTTFSMKTGEDFDESQEVSKLTSLEYIQGDTLYLDVLPDPYFSEHFTPTTGVRALEMTTVENGTVIMGNPHVNIVENVQDTIFEIAVFRSANGATNKIAIARAENIDYTFEAVGNSINFSPYYSFPKEDRFRDQRVYVEVRVPLGKSVYFSPKLNRVIYDVQNTTATYDSDMVDATWTMLSDGLTCLSCDPDKIKSKWRKSR